MGSSLTTDGRGGTHAFIFSRVAPYCTCMTSWGRSSTKPRAASRAAGARRAAPVAESACAAEIEAVKLRPLRPVAEFEHLGVVKFDRFGWSSLTAYWGERGAPHFIPREWQWRSLTTYGSQI